VSDEPVLLGGMALQNGILVHGPTHWAAAVRAPDGSVRVASGRKADLGAAGRTPLVRGVVRIAEALALLPTVRLALPEARLPMESARTGAAMAGATVVAAALRRNGRLPAWAAEGLAAITGIVPALVAVRGGDLARYHGAEHKAIGGYEHGEGAEEATKEHDRCGSHLVGPLMLATTAGNLAVRTLPRAQRGPARLAAGVAAIGVAVEAFAWMTRNRAHPLARALARPGHELQRVAATAEPSADELAVAEAALDEVLRLEGAPRVP
jgi:uncharacterized protein YqhQ